ncbi:MAG: hypothetical protein H8E78_03065, partial [Proteobacteria bacterium]|nr:hypothetical protein [Pseudomonadota bacterium]
MVVPAVESPRGPWLLGSVPDLLFGCGIAWMLVFALRSVAGAQVASWVSAAPLLILFSIPHYGATLIQAYESPEIRRKHVVISVYTSIFLSVAFAACLYSTLLGSVVLTIYLSWSPWHYSGQNYGIFLTLLGRRNIRPDERLKKWIHGSFVFSFVLTFLSLHGAAAAYAPVTYAGTVYQLLSIDVPYAIATVVVTIASAGYVLCLAQTFLGLKRHGSLLSMWPCFLILALQAMWFAVPVVIRQLGDQYGLTDSTGLYSAYGFQWIAAAHAVQYLWFCTYYTIRSTGERSILTYLGKCYLGGAAIWILPGVLFGPSLLGRISFDSGLALMVAAFVNLHHFVLDGAIWKLKDSGVSRVLFRAEASNEMTTPAEEDSTSRRRFRWGLAVFGGIAIACTALNF